MHWWSRRSRDPCSPPAGEGAPPEASPVGLPGAALPEACFIRVLASLDRAKNYVGFGPCFDCIFGGRLTKKTIYEKRAKASEPYGQECAETRHAAARSLDTGKVEHGFKNMFEVCQTEQVQKFAKSRPQRHEYSRTHPLIILFPTYMCSLRFSTENKNDQKLRVIELLP